MKDFFRNLWELCELIGPGGLIPLGIMLAWILLIASCVANWLLG